MPASETSSMIQPTFPSFMAVFGGQDASLEEDARRNIPSGQAQNSLVVHHLTANTQPQTQYYSQAKPRRRDSISSLTSTSTDSSPTTTMSTFDSPSITDQSPSSSPESPASTLPLSPFKAMMRSSEGNKQNDSQSTLRTQSDLISQIQSEPQANAGRNVKNLFLNMAVSSPTRPATSGGLESFNHPLGPLSPMREPLRTGRRKPTNLTIRTPGFEQLTFVRSASDVPPTPGQRPSLTHIQSSPALPSLMSPSVGPAGGMHLPLPPFSQGHSQHGSDSSFLTQSVTSSLDDLREEGPQKSQEVQEKGYTNGPVQIYDCGVFLYLEPTIEEARQFDTVINVAREIKNPFEELGNKSDTVMSVWRNKEDRSPIPEPRTAISEISFKSAFEWPQNVDNTTPTTPKQSSTAEFQQPEYIHVPWDHNSEIINDLFPLCKIIDERVAARKRVLIHCQLGVSRSASLVIAYGLYKGYQSTFPTMYDAVKERSQWVGPNMSLIYQLGDFRGQVDRNMHTLRPREAPAHWFRNPKPGSETALNPPNPALPQDGAHEPATKSILTQRAAPSWSSKPLPPLRLNKKLPPVPLFSRESPQSGELLRSVAYMPPSATNSALTSQSSNSAKRAADRPLPLRERLSPTREIPPHRPRKDAPAGLVLSQPKRQMDLAVQDVPSTPSLFSPRATEFMASPFGVTAAGDLHTGFSLTLPHSPFEPGQPSPAAVDPRSPHQRDDTGEILRHIDDIL